MNAEAAAGASVTRTAASSMRPLSLTESGLAIFVVRRVLKRRGFGGAIAWMRRRLEGTAATTSVDIEVVRRAEQTMALAAGLYPRRALCLEQSLTLYYVLRRRGVAVQYCQGVQRYPFSAHAWIEYRGELINDVDEHIKLFARFPSPLP